MDVLGHVYGDLVAVRAPVPVTVNKAGANYKSQVPHLEYSPRAAYREWLAICDSVVEAGGDALLYFEEDDEPFLGHQHLRVESDGSITSKGVGLGHIDGIHTGRVFAANGPWVARQGRTLTAVMPHMLAHRQAEVGYFEMLLSSVAGECGLELDIHLNPHRWEGMADVTAVGELAILTHAVAGHYDAGVAPQVQRSTLEGARFAADALLVPDAQRLFVELRYPHFHGDTVHFAARAEDGHRLLHYQGGLWGDGSRRISDRLKGSVVAIGERDAVDAYAANSRQIARTVLATEGVSPQFEAQLKTLGLDLVRLELAELFGKAGGGPGCATLYLPSNLDVPTDSPLRYSRMRELAHQRATRIPSRVTVAADFFDLRTKA